MQYKFDTESIEHGKAALLLYAMYKSRNNSSPLNGLETWDRFNTFVRGACLKSSTTAEFIQNFCKKAKIDSIKPTYLCVEDYPVKVAGTNELILSDSLYNYSLDIFSDDKILTLLSSETLYLIMLVRERIQREKLLGEDIENENKI